jgi:hypothetical protein
MKLIIAALAFALGLIVWHNRCEAGLCFDAECASSAFCGGSGCVCIKRPMDLTGYCADVSAVPAGYEVAP